MTITRKLAVALVPLLLASPALAQEIVVWDWKSGDPMTAGYYDAAREAFEAANPGVTVTYVMQPHDQYYTILGTALGSSEGPDLMLLHGGAQARERTGALVRLDDAVADIADTVVGWEEFTGDDGGLYAIPLSIQGFVVYYNRERYEEAGLDPDSPPANWDELLAACEAIAAAGSVPCFAMGNREGFAAEFFFSSIAANTFTPEQHEAWAEGSLNWSDPEVIDILQTWVETYERGWYNEGANSTAKFMDEYEIFMRGDAAHTIGLISDVAHWLQFGEFLGDENVGAFRHPAPGVDAEARLPFSGGIGYGVNRNSGNIELATELARTLAGAEAMQVFFNEAGAIPANTEVDTSDLESPSAIAILGWLSDSGAAMAHTNMSTAELDEWHRQSQLLLNGEVTVEDAAARLDEVQATAKPQG